MIKSVMNPWAGLASYEDPQNAEYDLKFCGRDDDSYDVARLIMGNVFVTLYGKSGIGKTSLLNAGVFPELREDGFTPISVRLGIRDEKNPKSFQRIIIDAVEQVIKNCDVIEVVPEQCDQTSKDYLWNYFARRRFYDKNEEQTIPVIVLDQFEEVFRKDRDEAEILLRQLDYLNDKDHALDACEVNGLAYRYEQNFRFTVSIREDDLYRLEDSLDNCYLPALKRNRYRLRSLSEEDAQKVILIPGEGLFRPEEQDGIVKRVIEATRQKGDDSISTNLLSLICNRLYNDCKNAGSEYISGSFVESFMKGNPIERFYNEATKGFSDKEKEYIENHLVDSNGRRNSISESDFKKHVPEGQKLLEGDSRILQRTSTSSDGASYRIELIHDSFCDPLVWQKEKRDKRKRRRHLIAMACVALISILTFTYIAHINWEMLKNRARFVAEKGMELIDDHDSYTARLLALEVIPKKLNFTTKPYVPETEKLLRYSLQNDDAVLKLSTSVSSASFSPDGSRVVSASYDGTIRIWDVSTGSVLTTLEGHTNLVNSASFSPDGSRVVSASYDNTIRIWDVSTGSVLKTLGEHTASVNSAFFSLDGSRVVSASDDRTIRIWDVSTGSVLKTLEGHTGWVYSASFSPDGSRIVSASGDKTIRIWDVATGAVLKTLEGHTNWVISASFSPDGSRVVSASYDGTIRIWDVSTGSVLTTLEGHTNLVNSASFSPDGSRVVSASVDKTIRIWDVSTGSVLTTLEGHTNWVISASFSPDGSRVVSASWDNTIRIWDVSTGSVLKTLGEHTASVNSAFFSPDGSRVVSASDDRTIRIWDVATGSVLTTLEGHTDVVKSASFSPDGSRVVSASWDNTIRIWDVSTGSVLKTLGEHTASVKSASFSPDGSRVVSASVDRIVIWDVSTGSVLTTLEGHTYVVNSASFSPDGSRVVSASDDRTIRIWDVATGSVLTTLEGHTDIVKSASFSPDGSRVVSASWDNTIRIWDVSTGSVLKTLGEHTASVNSAFFSPDGSRVVSASDDGTIRIWDVSTGVSVLKTLAGHTNWVNSASFSPDGSRVVFAAEKAIQIFDFPPLQELIDQTREQFKNRKLTPEERRKYYLE